MRGKKSTQTVDDNLVNGQPRKKKKKKKKTHFKELLYGMYKRTGRSRKNSSGIDGVGTELAAGDKSNNCDSSSTGEIERTRYEKKDDNRN